MNWDNDRALLILLQSGLAGCIYCVMILALITQESEMKISKSKQELARIISENGGWRNGEFAAQDGDGLVGGYGSKPEWNSLAEYWWREALGGWFLANKIKNHHQTVLSRAEYFHLYPSPDADGWIEWKGGECPVDKYARIDIRMTGGITHYDTDTHWGWNADSFKITHYRLHKPEVKPGLCESVTRSIPGSESIDELCAKVTEENKHPHVDAKPTIEQLAADYHNAKDYADRKQQEADAAKADADEKLRVLEIAGEALSLLVSPITEKQESELVISVQVGDEVECVESNIKPDKYNGMVGTVSSIDVDDTSTPYLVDFCGEAKIWCHEVKFIRRP